MSAVEKITFNGEVLAILASTRGQPDGATFLTDPAMPMQVGVLKHKAGHVIEAHEHKPVTRTLHGVHETLIVKSGRLRADVYAGGGVHVASREIRGGDVLILLAGGHGFEVIEDCEVIEVRSGPYPGTKADKVKFGG